MSIATAETGLFGESVAELFAFDGQTDDSTNRAITTPGFTKTTRRRKTVQVEPAEPELNLTEEQEALYWYLDDEGKTTSREVAEKLLPRWIIHMETNSTNIHLEAGWKEDQALPCRDTAASDLHFPEPPEESDYPEGANSMEYKVLFRKARIQKIEARSNCFSCPVVESCTVRAIISSKQNVSQSVESFLEDGDLTIHQARRLASEIFYPGIWGGWDSWERIQIEEALDSLYQEYRLGVDSLMSGLRDGDEDYEGMPMAEIAANRKLVAAIQMTEEAAA